MPFDLAPADPCLFCERIAGEREDWSVIAEDDLTIAFVASKQFEEGQSLLIPRRHVPTILELSDAEASGLMQMTARVARAVTKAFEPNGITLYQNNGLASLQEIPHVHMHVVPRRYGGGWGEGPPHLAKLIGAERDAWLQRNASPAEERAALAGRIRTALAELA
jgi:histidine triad (HIT) family protein